MLTKYILNFYRALTPMIMNIEKKGNQFVITVPDNIGLEGVQQLIDYLIYKQATQNSQATQSDVDKLARAVNKGWWEKNKDKYFPK